MVRYRFLHPMRCVLSAWRTATLWLGASCGSFCSRYGGDGQRRRPANMTMGILMRVVFMIPAGLGLESFSAQVSGRASPQISPSFN